jgi:hypothetical protein
VYRAQAAWLERRLEKIPEGIPGIARARKRIHEATVVIRREIMKILRSAAWDSARLALRNMGDAIDPVFRDNAESIGQAIQGAEALDNSGVERALLEDRLSFGVTQRLASAAKGAVVMNSLKWSKVLDRVYKSVVKANNEGLTLSNRVFDITDQTERSLHRILSRDISAGVAPRDVAKKAKKFLSAEALDPEFAAPGIYRNPMKNAMRLARTETNRAYTLSSSAWADEKPWVDGVRVTLSKIHGAPDICDDYAGDLMTPDGFAATFPLHPHCMCWGTFVIKKEFLTEYDD